MELSGYEAPSRPNGDGLPAKEAVDKPLIVVVREHRQGIVTKFSPDGKDGITVDVADLTTDSTFLDVLWMNGAIVDGLAPHVGKAMPVKLVWTPGKSGYPYLSVAPLEGAELQLAAAWATKNGDRIERERAERGFGKREQAGALPGHGVPPADAPIAAGASDDADVQALLAKLSGK
ncbi:hypothetical protein [Saccharopolyspora hattusasensis]|uniref:hypothetical protein n=1 Tax=Saccharopolyspora hattusasensis TaxID=1128679 RepID=UPI003D99B30A